ncbi:MAG: hypothetical protein JNJ73_12025 [Hyphomonadaceae bacterium]|nr:hypothetical protein [Hyphomonadaceae bacterium]
MDVEISRIAGASLAENGRDAAIEFVSRTGEHVSLILDPQDQEELLKLIEALRARTEARDEASAIAPEAAPSNGATLSAWSAAYQNVQSVEIGVDASLTTLLIDFDRDDRRVGVALPVDMARKVGMEIRQTANKALAAAAGQRAS